MERDAGRASPPVFVWDPRRERLLAFGSAEAAAAHLAPWQEVGAAVAYDARGRQVTFAVVPRRYRVLGLFPATRDEVAVAGVEREPGHHRELRAALVAELARRGQRRAGLDALSLAELVEAAGGTSAG